jgi:hypothetical protein
MNAVRFEILLKPCEHENQSKCNLKTSGKVDCTASNYYYRILHLVSSFFPSSSSFLSPLKQRIKLHLYSSNCIAWGQHDTRTYPQTSSLHIQIYLVPTLRSSPGSNPDQVMWDLKWTTWHWGEFCPSTSVSPANSHSTNCSTFTNHPIIQAT